MTTKDYIKLLVVAAGYTKNIKIDIDQYGIDRMYSVYAEKFDYNDDGTDDIIIDDNETYEDKQILDIKDEPCLLTLIREIIDNKTEDCVYKLNHLPLYEITDDKTRENVLYADKQLQEEIERDIAIMKPVDEYIGKTDPCKDAPNCKGDFDDSDTCHGFWKCTHQYHNNCPLVHEHHKLSYELRHAYRKYAYKDNGKLLPDEKKLLTEHNLIKKKMV